LVDWLYQYAEETNQPPPGASVGKPKLRPKGMYLTRIGPIILLQTSSEEFYASMQIAYNQADQATCVFTRWEIDGEASCQRISGSNQDWPKLWAAFLAFLPTDVAAEIRPEEDAVRD
jgi:hypothetical protein